jgi:hypothetical protein
MHSSFALLLTTSLPFAGSAAAQDIWPKTGPSSRPVGEEQRALPAPDPVLEFATPAAFMPVAVAA